MREFDLLKHIQAANPSLGEQVKIPPGDDMAMIRLNDRVLLAAVDQLVGGRHFDPGSTPIELVGRKALTRCLSDVAAMAAQPVASLAAATLPSGFDSVQAKLLFDAMRKTAQHYHAPLIGGDIAIHREDQYPMVCAVTVFAEPSSRAPVRRSSAKVGDRVYVTGCLGGSLNADGSGHHLTFEPRINEAIKLLELLGDRLHAMIDISDGLGRDAAHIAETSGVCIELIAAAIPCRGHLDWRRAMGDGEDYELCFTASGDVPGSLDGVPVTMVGEVYDRNSQDQHSVEVLVGDQRIAVNEYGWEHQT